MIEIIHKQSGYATKECETANLPLSDDTDYFMEKLIGNGIVDADKTVVEIE